MIERTRRNLIRRTVWALQEQLKHGRIPRRKALEVKLLSGGRIDRVDIMEEPEKNRVYVKVIDYKTGNTSFDMLCTVSRTAASADRSIWMVRLKVEQRKYPGRRSRSCRNFLL